MICMSEGSIPSALQASIDRGVFNTIGGVALWMKFSKETAIYYIFSLVFSGRSTSGAISSWSWWICSRLPIMPYIATSESSHRWHTWLLNTCIIDSGTRTFSAWFPNVLTWLLIKFDSNFIQFICCIDGISWTAGMPCGLNDSVWSIWRIICHMNRSKSHWNCRCGWRSVSSS